MKALPAAHHVYHLKVAEGIVDTRNATKQIGAHSEREQLRAAYNDRHRPGDGDVMQYASFDGRSSDNQNTFQ